MSKISEKEAHDNYDINSELFCMEEFEKLWQSDVLNDVYHKSGLEAFKEYLMDYLIDIYDKTFFRKLSDRHKSRFIEDMLLKNLEKLELSEDEKDILVKKLEQNPHYLIDFSKNFPEKLLAVKEQNLMNKDIIKVVNNKTETKEPSKPKGLRV